MVKKTNSNNVLPKSRELGKGRLFYLILALGFLGMIILYIGGTFEPLPPASVNFTGTEQPGSDPHSGADLNQLQRIKELEAKAENTNDPETILELGHLYNDSGFFDKAIETYKKYLAKNPRNADVLVDLGVCYFNLQNYDEAEKAMKNAINLVPNHQIGKFNLGIVNFSKGNIDEAKKWWQECIQINPNTEIGIKAKSLLESH